MSPRTVHQCSSTALDKAWDLSPSAAREETCPFPECPVTRKRRTMHDRARALVCVSLWKICTRSGAAFAITCRYTRQSIQLSAERYAFLNRVLLVPSWVLRLATPHSRMWFGVRPLDWLALPPICRAAGILCGGHELRFPFVVFLARLGVNVCRKCKDRCTHCVADNHSAVTSDPEHDHM